VEVQQFVSNCFLFSFSVRNTKTQTYISYTVKSGFGGEKKFFFLTNGKTVGTSATRAADDLSYFPIQIDSRINKLIQQKEKPRALLFPNTHTNTSAVVCLCVCLTDRKRKQSITIGQCDHPHTQTNTHTHTHPGAKPGNPVVLVGVGCFPPYSYLLHTGSDYSLFTLFRASNYSERIYRIK
jgi:hypothetical protein